MSLDVGCVGFGFEFGAEGGFEVAAGEDGDDLFGRRELVGVEERGGEGDGAGGFGGEVGGLQDEAEGGADLVFGDGDDAVDVLEDVLEVALAEGLGAEAIGEGAGGLGGGPLDKGAGVEGLFGVGGEGWFYAVDLGLA